MSGTAFEPGDVPASPDRLQTKPIPGTVILRAFFGVDALLGRNSHNPDDAMLAEVLNQRTLRQPAIFTTAYDGAGEADAPQITYTIDPRSSQADLHVSDSGAHRHFLLTYAPEQPNTAVSFTYTRSAKGSAVVDESVQWTAEKPRVVVVSKFQGKAVARAYYRWCAEAGMFDLRKTTYIGPRDEEPKRYEMLASLPQRFDPAAYLAA